MNRIYDKQQPNGYEDSIQKGINAVRTFHSGLIKNTDGREVLLGRLKNEVLNADAVVIGAGAGLSTSAGLTYSGERFDRYFYDFRDRYGIRDMYTGGFYPFPDDETRWAWWARHIYFNRYVEPPKPVYRDLLKLVKNKDYFVITTNVDHQFQRAGFDKSRLFYTQGDYGLFQSADSEHNRKTPLTYENEAWVMSAMKAQGFVINGNGVCDLPADGTISMQVPTELIPRCPDDGSEVTMNLRGDDSFVEDAGWYQASAAYAGFLEEHDGMHVLFIEIGVGMNTPVIIKYPFWQMTHDNKNAVYACLNYNEAYAPAQIADRSICIDGDTGEMLEQLSRL